MGTPDAEQKSPVHPPATGIPMGAAAPMYTEMPSAPPNFQPPPHQLQPESNGQWSVGLFDCFSDCGRCCISCWCPCITFGQISEILDRGSSSCGVNGALYFLIAAVTGCACVYSCVYRTKMRQQYKLEGSSAEDFFVHCCCEPCSLTQQYRELENRGFDVSIGWQGNVERQTRGVAVSSHMPPVTESGMKR
ncbi:protein PLANT CADMIUM RESISTANCE 2-like [Punica granatum]|uniref:Uncharacterized protein n=2 Tax=Punica granatum TaxID=22663 RepID=A0A218WUY4_PUNGR|nr:protein PLANT CADMIUM RESISTANCE 2-like [Punica granatum]OWM76657.1 hypothetical protein CDL15_Pgr009222 [Punica granatum]PKI48604.1 hypothetical protein CRG98_031023 [Punica granatum]